MPHTLLKHVFQILMWLNGQFSCDTFVMHCGRQVVVRSPGLSVISVQCGRQTLWVRFGHFTAVHAASWRHHQMPPPSLPTNRQLADALTKDAADPVDLLRSCMRSGEDQLSPISADFRPDSCARPAAWWLLSARNALF